MADFWGLMRQAKRTQHELAQLLRMAEEITESTDRTALTEQEKRVYGYAVQLQDHANSLKALTDFALAADSAEGYLYRQENGRYCVDNNPDHELTSGTMLQYRDDETGIFYTSRLEYGDGDYYIVDLGKGCPLASVFVIVKNSSFMYR